MSTVKTTLSYVTHQAMLLDNIHLHPSAFAPTRILLNGVPAEVTFISRDGGAWQCEPELAIPPNTKVEVEAEIPSPIMIWTPE